MKHGKIAIADPSIILGSKRNYIGVEPYPYTTLIKGDCWLELDPSDDLIEKWFWNGTYWLSQQKYDYGESFSNLSANQFFCKDIPELNAFLSASVRANLFFVSLKGILYQTANNPNNSQWSISAQRFNSSNSLSTLATIGNDTISPNAWGTREAVMNFSVDTSATQMAGLRITMSRIGNPPQISGAAQITYRKSRP